MSKRWVMSAPLSRRNGSSSPCKWSGNGSKQAFILQSVASPYSSENPSRIDPKRRDRPSSTQPNLKQHKSIRQNVHLYLPVGDQGHDSWNTHNRSSTSSNTSRQQHNEDWGQFDGPSPPPRRSRIITVNAYVNGSRDIMVEMAVSNMKKMLELSTFYLELPHKAWRVFLANGKEVTAFRNIPNFADVYISMGEDFKDPYRWSKVSWTLNGLMANPDVKRKVTKPRITKSLKNLCGAVCQRVLVFKNGCHSGGVEVVADLNNKHFLLENFLVECTSRLDLNSNGKVLYNWEGKKVQDLKDTPVLSQCLQLWSTPVLGPLWVSKGEPLSHMGILNFLLSLIRYARSLHSKACSYQKQLRLRDEQLQGKGSGHEIRVVTIMSMSQTEVDELLAIVDKDIEDYGKELVQLKALKKKAERKIKHINNGKSK